VSDATAPLRERVDRLLAGRRLAFARLSAERQGLADAQARHRAALEAQQAVQIVSEAVQRQAHSQIAGVVTKCLAAVFEQPYTFDILFEKKRGRTEARLVFTRDGVEIDEPAESMGGGVIDVAAFALRLASLMLAKPPLRRLLVLDEPFKHLDAQRRPRVRALIEALAGELGVQFILCTHDEQFHIAPDALGRWLDGEDRRFRAQPPQAAAVGGGVPGVLQADLPAGSGRPI
jgi:ATPase subunit of ABC transporter with duplicated ATPase domains